MALTIKIKTKNVSWHLSPHCDMSCGRCCFLKQPSDSIRRGSKIQLSFQMKCSSELHVPNIWSINNHIRQGNHYRRGPRTSWNKCVHTSLTQAGRTKWNGLGCKCVHTCSHSKPTRGAEHILRLFKLKAWTSMWNVHVSAYCKVKNMTDIREFHMLYCGIMLSNSDSYITVSLRLHFLKPIFCVRCMLVWVWACMCMCVHVHEEVNIKYINTASHCIPLTNMGLLHDHTR